MPVPSQCHTREQTRRAMVAVHALPPIPQAPRPQRAAASSDGNTAASRCAAPRWGTPTQRATEGCGGDVCTPRLQHGRGWPSTRRGAVRCHAASAGRGLRRSALWHCAPLQADARLVARPTDTHEANGARISPSRMGAPAMCAAAMCAAAMCAAAMCVPCVWLHRAVNSATAHPQSGVERRRLEDAACSLRARASLLTAHCSLPRRAPSTPVVPHRTQAGL
jgi:hypothetical protein